MSVSSATPREITRLRVCVVVYALHSETPSWTVRAKVGPRTSAACFYVTRVSDQPTPRGRTRTRTRVRRDAKSQFRRPRTPPRAVVTASFRRLSCHSRARGRAGDSRGCLAARTRLRRRRTATSTASPRLCARASIAKQSPRRPDRNPSRTSRPRTGPSLSGSRPRRASRPSRRGRSRLSAPAPRRRRAPTRSPRARSPRPSPRSRATRARRPRGWRRSRERSSSKSGTPIPSTRRSKRGAPPWTRARGARRWRGTFSSTPST